MFDTLNVSLKNKSINFYQKAYYQNVWMVVHMFSQ